MVGTAIRCLRYVASTPKLGLLFHRSPQSVLGGILYSGSPVCAFADSSFAESPDDRKSTAGMALLFNGTAVMWWSKTLKTVACSSQDAEYMALSDTSREIVFVQNLLASVGYHVDGVTLHGDNKGSLFLAEHPGDHQKSKHIEVRYFFVRQKVEEGRLQFVKTTQQWADVLTKALAKVLHRRFSLHLMGHHNVAEQVSTQ